MARRNRNKILVPAARAGLNQLKAKVAGPTIRKLPNLR